jgi:hypothetical protein
MGGSRDWTRQIPRHYTISILHQMPVIAVKRKRPVADTSAKKAKSEASVSNNWGLAGLMGDYSMDPIQTRIAERERSRARTSIRRTINKNTLCGLSLF